MAVEVSVTRIAHSCMLISLGEDVFLTDPWFADHSPVYRAGEPRSHTAADLPALTGVLVSHAHRDHSDLDALASAGRRNVPVVGDPSVADRAKTAGLESFHGPRWWASTTLGSTRITAVPARHKVPETTFVLSREDTTVYFAGDSLYIPELDEIPRRFGHLTLALLPTNGLRIRPLFNRKVVMDAEDAARLTAVLDPDVVVPHHYAFSSGPVGDRLLTNKDRDPENYRRAAARLAPRTEVRILPTGLRSVIAPDAAKRGA
ncbi:MBL fold metallo-hydrolase [Glycomyces paridis]|uniref:MBL fold metallo-hydrolase n=1 Tax=Glycomyces paridis TaxID=2126555 RepID=A0A4S8PHG5_9ACTN|nr:MBL fold metallo-hydrolase [Glycomyces paridis]THV30030.1 MBL fold metallo-hydrolase [Glycomyces paridis]